MERTKKVLRIAKRELQENAAWFMRQAGRFLPEYESLKVGRPFLEFIKDPDTVEKVSLLPLKYFDTDAIVIFTDILLPFTKLDYQLSYENGISVKEGRRDDFDYYASLSTGLKKISEERSDKTIIGVVGGPFTTLFPDPISSSFHSRDSYLLSPAGKGPYYPGQCNHRKVV